MLPLVPTLWLAFSPPATDYLQATGQLDQALESAATDDPAKAIAALELALEQVSLHPEEVPSDAETLEKLLKARVSLAWLLLDSDKKAAADAMDEAIRSARGGELAAARSFGPEVYRLYDERRDALKDRGTGTIEVDCQVPCEVVINERRSPTPSDPLYLGTYRVWVAARDGGDWTYFQVDLDEKGEVERITYETAMVAPANGSSSETIPPNAKQPGKMHKRMLPRWLEVVTLTAGAGLAITGGVLLSLNGKCKGGGDPSNPDECPEIWENSPQGYALIGTGAGVFALAGIMLTIDEVRVARTKAQQAMLTWTFRF